MRNKGKARVRLTAMLVRGLGGVLCTGAMLIALGGMAHAEPTAEDRAAAELLFSEAGKLYQAGRYAEACSKLADSEKLDPAVGTLLNLGRCYEKLGRTASAWLTFLDAAAAAKRAGESEREEVARKSADALAGSLPKLDIEIPSGAAASGLQVTRDGTELPRALWNTPTPIDPGEHQIKCTAPGKKPWSTGVRAESGKVTKVSIPSLEDEPRPVTAAHTSSTGQTSAGRTGNISNDEAKKASTRRARRTAALIAGGAGVVAAAVGTVFGLNAKSDRDFANDKCPGEFCDDPSALDRNSRAHQRAAIATAAFAVAGAAIAAGAVLWLTAPKVHDTEQQRDGAARPAGIALGPSIGRDNAGLFLSGAF